MNLGDLADSCRLLGPSLTRIVRDLEEESSYIDRPINSHRRWLISISSAGQALIQRVGPHSGVTIGRYLKRSARRRLKTCITS